jgi:hypothetical protein
MADKIPKVISNATVIKVLAKVFAFQAIEINLLRSHAGISDANWKALKTEAFKKTYAKQRSFYEDRLTGAFALEHLSQSVARKRGHSEFSGAWRAGAFLAVQSFP